MLVSTSERCLVKIDEAVDSFFDPISRTLSSIVFYEIDFFGAQCPIVVLWLIAGGLFTTFYLGFVAIRGFPEAFRILLTARSDVKQEGEVSAFQALSTALSGTVGVGNMAGVAVAISVGGPGATLWMIFAGFLGMSTKFVECCLGVTYRLRLADGSVSGGPMHYLSRGLAERGLPGLGRVMGGFYAVAIVVCCLGSGNMFQANQAYSQILAVSGGEASFFVDKGWLFGLLFASIVAAVIVGGIRSIAQVAEKVVPFMALLYLGSASFVLIFNFEALGFAFSKMVEGAFSGDGIKGGVFGVMMIGFRRAIFSNEAGIGTASIAHSAVRTEKPITEGFVSLLEPFIDTIVISTMTALVIVTTQYYEPGFDQGLRGIEMTSVAFERVSSWFPYFIAASAVLFSFSTIIAWAYYGLKGWTYLWGEGAKRRKVFFLIYSGFVVLGCSIPLRSVLNFSDAMTFLICVPNLLGIYLLAPVVKRQMQDYFSERSGALSEKASVAQSAVTRLGHSD